MLFPWSSRLGDTTKSRLNAGHPAPLWSETIENATNIVKNQRGRSEILIHKCSRLRFKLRVTPLPSDPNRIVREHRPDTRSKGSSKRVGRRSYHHPLTGYQVTAGTPSLYLSPGGEEIRGDCMAPARGVTMLRVNGALIGRRLSDGIGRPPRREMALQFEHHVW